VCYADYAGGTRVEQNAFSITDDFFNIIYDLDGGSWETSEGMVYYTSDLTGSYYTLPSLSKYSSVFLGWYLEDADGNESYLEDDSLYLSGENLHVVAKFEPLDGAILKSGTQFNAAIKKLASGKSKKYTDTDTNITRIVMSDTRPDANTVTTVHLEAKESACEILGWYDSGTLYVYSFSDVIYTNSNSTFMFNLLSNLEYVDLSRLDTHVTNKFTSYFAGCSSLSFLDISYMNTSNGITFENFFSDCTSLSSINVSNIDTSSAKKLKGFFKNCSSLSSIDVSNFNTAKCENMREMFYGCSSLSTIDLSNFDTTNCGNLRDMFNGCSSLSNVDLSSFNTSKVSTLQGMFRNCSSLVELNLSTFDTSNVTWMQNMFNADSNLVTIYVSNLWTTKSVEDGRWMFTDCVSLVGGNGTVYSSSYTNNKYARIDTKRAPGYLTSYVASTASALSLDMNDESEIVYKLESH
jgi:surface protein